MGEGTTEPDVENLQVLGWEWGADEKSALKTFLERNTHISELFSEYICVEVKRPPARWRTFLF
ncbi:MAG: hypothetical protein J7L88_06465 [Thermoplasmata archaeon]|nr:hypothetical protein [Thermoplasmata archaeon]